MFRKPVSIIFFSIIFFISPLFILVFNAALNMVPIIGPGSIIYRLQPFDLLILLLYITASISIFLVRKWGWWVFISSAFIMILYNIITIFFNPFSSVIIALLMNLTLFSVAAVFFRRHIIAPYFNPRLRWWEQDQRYEIDIYLKFPGINRNVIISDISEGGCYVYVDFLIDTGVELPISIVCGSFHLNLNARIMRIARESDRYYGYGLMFIRIDPVQKKGLDQLLKKLKNFSGLEEDNIDSDEKRASNRYFIGYDLSISQGNGISPANLADISKSGCSIYTSINLETGTNCFLHFSFSQIGYSLTSRVIWKSNHRNSSHYGLKFIDIDNPGRSALRKVIKTASSLGARKRIAHREDYLEQCEETLKNTPFKIILKIKTLFRKR